LAVVDADEADVVRRVFERFVAEASPRTIAAELNRDGVRAPYETRGAGGALGYESKTRPEGPSIPLSGLLVCATCGSRMSSSTGSRSTTAASDAVATRIRSVRARVWKAFRNRTPPNSSPLSATWRPS
jgi:hypothetical protein